METKTTKNGVRLLIPPEAIMYVPERLLKVTENFLYEKNRRYYGEAAIGLKNQLTDPQFSGYDIKTKAVNLGIQGEKETSKTLRKWIKDKPDVVLIDSIHLPISGEEQLDEEEEDEEEEEEAENGKKSTDESGSVNVLGDTDHLLIIKNTIVVIDSKNWKAKASYSVDENGKIKRGNTYCRTPKIRATRYLWNKFYKNFNVDIEMYVCLSNDVSFITRDRNWWASGFKLVNQETLVYFLDKLYNSLSDNEEKYIRVDIVAKALTGLQRPYDPLREEFPEVYSRLKGGKKNAK